MVAERNYEICLLSLMQRGLHHGSSRCEVAPILIVLAEPGRVDRDDRDFGAIGNYCPAERPLFRREPILVPRRNCTLEGTIRRKPG